MRMVDEDGISLREAFDARTRVEDTPCCGVAVFDREFVAPCECGQVQPEIPRDLAAVDQHLRARAHGRGDRLYAYISGSRRSYVSARSVGVRGAVNQRALAFSSSPIRYAIRVFDASAENEIHPVRFHRGVDEGE